jgi:hypothetical protein
VPEHSIPMTIEVDNASKITISGVVCELIQVGIISLNKHIYLFIYLFVCIVDSNLFLVV